MNKSLTHERTSRGSTSALSVYWQRGVLVCGLLFTSCAPCTLFPVYVRDGTDSQFNFQEWQTRPDIQRGRKVELGGRIVETHIRGARTTIIVAELPVVERPAYGPTDASKSKGRFVLSLSGHIDPKWTQVGNRLVAIGTTSARERESVDEVSRLLPALQARCIHFWATLGSEIGQFAHTGSHEAAAQETMCWSHENASGSSYVPACDVAGL